MSHPQNPFSLLHNCCIGPHTPGKILLAEQKNFLVAAFHPELTDDTRIHEYFLKKCELFINLESYIITEESIVTIMPNSIIQMKVYCPLCDPQNLRYFP